MNPDDHTYADDTLILNITAAVVFIADSICYLMSWHTERKKTNSITPQDHAPVVLLLSKIDWDLFAIILFTIASVAYFCQSVIQLILRDYANLVPADFILDVLYTHVFSISSIIYIIASLIRKSKNETSRVFFTYKFSILDWNAWGDVVFFSGCFISASESWRCYLADHIECELMEIIVGVFFVVDGCLFVIAEHFGDIPISYINITNVRDEEDVPLVTPD